MLILMNYNFYLKVFEVCRRRTEEPFTDFFKRFFHTLIVRRQRIRTEQLLSQRLLNRS